MADIQTYVSDFTGEQIDSAVNKILNTQLVGSDIANGAISYNKLDADMQNKCQVWDNAAEEYKGTVTSVEVNGVEFDPDENGKVICTTIEPGVGSLTISAGDDELGQFTPTTDSDIEINLSKVAATGDFLDLINRPAASGVQDVRINEESVVDEHGVANITALTDATLNGESILDGTIVRVPYDLSSYNNDCGFIASGDVVDEALHAGSADTATTAASADYATSAGSASTADSATTAASADYASSAGEASEAAHASSATNADYATAAGSADTATTATNAGHADTADSATVATNAGNATTAGKAETVQYYNNTTLQSTGLTIKRMTNSQYSGLSTKDSNTLYLVTGS